MKDWTNHRFGRLQVIKFVGLLKRNKRSIYQWECLCDCGNNKVLDIADLKKGSTNSCGCFRKQFQSDVKKLPDGIAAANNLYYSYKIKCGEKRGYDFKLTKGEFLVLTKQNCYYCNKPPSQIKKAKHSNYIYNGVDRVDNNKGYLIENVVACCKECNSKKSGITLEIAEKIIEFLKKKEVYIE